MKLAFIVLPVMLATCTSLTVVEADRAAALDSLVKPFSSHDKRAPEVFEDLAHHAHVPIGISGFVVPHAKGKDKSISIDFYGKSLRQILQEICKQDPDYSWTQFSDGGINVRLGSRPLSLIDVSGGNLNIKDARPSDTLVLFLHLPELDRWKHSTGCQVGHAVVINGQSPPDSGWRANLQVQGEPLWRAFNRLSIESQTYFWSAVGSPGSPCYVFVDILVGK